MEKYRYSGKIRPGEALIKTLVYPASSMFCLSYAMVCKFKTPTNSGRLVVMWPADARAFSRPTSKAGEKRPGDEVEEPYRWGGTYLYSLYKGVPSPRCSRLYRLCHNIPGRLSLVAISFYALSLLFGSCRLSEFTLAWPLFLLLSVFAVPHTVSNIA